MGDMNADCRYLSKRRTKQLDLRNDGSYWLIPDEVDTTVAKGNCAYDRYICILYMYICMGQVWAILVTVNFCHSKLHVYMLKFTS